MRVGEILHLSYIYFKTKTMKILIDCGHNHSDTWQKMSPIRKDGTRFYEYQSNRTIGKMLAEELRKLGIAYEFINYPDDANDMSLEKRVNIANNIARKEGKSNVLYLSLHSDAYGDGNDWYDDIRGFSIYTSKGKTKSDEYAKIFLKHYTQLLSGITKNRGVKEENFYVLKHTICPAILIENLFYTSHKDLAVLDSDEGRRLIAKAIVDSIKEIVGK